MTTLIKRRRIEYDRWLRLPAEAEDAPREGDVIVPLALWRARGEVLRWRYCSLGVWLEGHEDPAAIERDLHVFHLIALRVGGFADGRALSAARLLRERYRWRGELRAFGDVGSDLLPFLERAGFDAFELREDENAEAALAALGEIRVQLPAFRRSASQSA
ncbi:MAG TPA: DUF934 domain-containing protein [Burkholderiales bacterium]|nr:DUF934 domain-containing protein [Burkholderiales bacterium]